MPLGLGLMMGLGHNVAASGGGGGGGGSAWAAATGYTLSGSNSIATRSSAAGTQFVLSSTSNATGTGTVTVGGPVGSSGSMSVGLVQGAPGAYIGDSNTSIGYQSWGTINFGGGVAQGSLPTYTAADVIDMVWNGTTVQFKKNGTNVGTAVDIHATITTPKVVMETDEVNWAGTLSNW